jgi:hypothetical protein
VAQQGVNGFEFSPELSNTINADPGKFWVYAAKIMDSCLLHDNIITILERPGLNFGPSKIILYNKVL